MTLEMDERARERGWVNARQMTSRNGADKIYNQTEARVFAERLKFDGRLRARVNKVRRLNSIEFVLHLLTAELPLRLN